MRALAAAVLVLCAGCGGVLQPAADTFPVSTNTTTAELTDSLGQPDSYQSRQLGTNKIETMKWSTPAGGLSIIARDGAVISWNRPAQ